MIPHAPTCRMDGDMPAGRFFDVERCAACRDLAQEEAKSKPKSTRGFASMDKAKQRDIASKGGKAAHARGTAHQFTHEEAVAAGRRSHTVGNAHEYTAEEGRAARAKAGPRKPKVALTPVQLAQNEEARQLGEI